MIALYVLLAAAAPGVVTPEAPATPVPELVRDVLSDRRFQFCHDPHYPLTQDEEALCHLGAAPTKTCPAFAEACRRGVTAHQTDTVTQRSWNLPGLGFLKPVGLVLVVGLLVLLGRALLSNFRLGAFRASAPPPASRPPPPAPVAAAPPESDADRLLARAEAAAAAGDHARAVVDLHGSLLRRLEAGGVIAFHPSRTNGEYVRAAGRVRPALVGPLRGFVHDVEAVQFGATAPGPEIYRSLLARLHQLTTATLLVMMMFVVGCGQRVDWDGSPSGRAAVLALLGRTGKQAHERLKPLTQLRTDGSDAVVLLPRAEVSEADWKVLSGFVSEGGLLVLAGLPVGAPAWLGVKVVPVSDDGPVVTRGNDDRLLLSLPPSPHLELESGFECALERARSSYAAVRERGEGEVMAFADDHLFMNGSLLFADNALALVRFFRGYQRIEFVGEETGLVSPDPVTSVTRGRLMPFLAQLGLVIAAFFLMRGIPFGRLREPPGSARRSFAEHTAALAQQYHLARAAPYLTGSYARFAAERLRQRMVLPASTALPVLAEVVARRAGRAPAEVLALLGEASDPNPQAALARLRGLGTLLDQMEDPVNADDFRDTFDRLRAEVARVLVGQDELIAQTLLAVVVRGHVLLEGAPGLGKTLLVRTLARVLGCTFKRIQFTPDLMPSDVTGGNVFNQQKNAFEFFPGPVFTQLLLADEINRAPAKTQAALLEAMQERSATTDGVTRPLPQPFFVIATQNPIESQGTYPLPEAQLDRFLFKLDVLPPSREQEKAILLNHLGGFDSTALERMRIETITNPAELLSLHELIRATRVDDSVLDYITEIVGRSRAHRALLFGASPRASIALLQVAQARAASEGRDFVIPDDVKALAPAVLRHRVGVHPDAEIEGISPDTCVEEILRETRVPKLAT